MTPIDDQHNNLDQQMINIFNVAKNCLDLVKTKKVGEKNNRIRRPNKIP